MVLRTQRLGHGRAGRLGRLVLGVPESGRARAGKRRKAAIAAAPAACINVPAGARGGGERFLIYGATMPRPVGCAVLIDKLCFFGADPGTFAVGSAFVQNTGGPLSVHHSTKFG